MKELMKICSRCGEEKPLNDFWRKNKGDEARQAYCKPCDLESSRVSRNNHLIVRRRKDREKHKRRTPQKKTYFSKKDPQRVNAAHAVRDALERGRLLVAGKLNITKGTGHILFKTNHCQACNTRLPENALYGHHHLGYEPEHWLDVIWMCRPCHTSLHIALREADILKQSRSSVFKKFMSNAKDVTDQVYNNLNNKGDNNEQ